jgi:hypothetical protein
LPGASFFCFYARNFICLLQLRPGLQLQLRFCLECLQFDSIGALPHLFLQKTIETKIRNSDATNDRGSASVLYRTPFLSK